MRPVLGLFFGLSGGAKKWRQTLDVLSRDLGIRNCGPAHILKQGMSRMPESLLNQEFRTMPPQEN